MREEFQSFNLISKLKQHYRSDYMNKNIKYIAIVDCEIKGKDFKAGDTVNVQVPRWMVLQGLVLPEDKAKKLEEE